MITTIKLLRRPGLMSGVLFTILCFAITGCEFLPESTFNLANESRLPKWFFLPPGQSRADVSVSMSYYISPSGERAKFTLLDARRQILGKAKGKAECEAPFELKGAPRRLPSDYPTYEAVTVNGLTEMIEHRKMEPVFFVTDDPAVWKQYRAIGCSKSAG